MEKLCVMTYVNKNQDGSISLSGTQKIECPDPSVDPKDDLGVENVISGAYLSFPDEPVQPKTGGGQCSVENLKQKDHDIIKSFICKQIKKKIGSKEEEK